MLSALGHAISQLAISYADLGRHQEALVMQEETLEFQRRVLPENHPDIGATWLCSVLIEVQIDVLWSRLFNGQSRQHLLRSWAAPRCSCDEREDA